MIHNPDLPITLPPREDQLFAVVDIQNTQYKLVAGDILLIPRLKGYEVNDQIQFESVSLVGTPEYTLIGRPIIPNTRVNFFVFI